MILLVDTLSGGTDVLLSLFSARQITINDLPVGRSVDETIRLIKAFQFTVCRSTVISIDI